MSGTELGAEPADERNPTVSGADQHAEPHFEPLRGRTLGAFVLVTLIWGSTWLVIRDQVSPQAHFHEMPAGWTVTWRFTLASLGMFALALVRGERLGLASGGAAIAVPLGFFQFFANFQLVYRAEQHLTSGVVAVLYALLMVPNALLAWLFLGTRVSGRFVAGSVVALAGIVLLVLREVHAAPPRGTLDQGSVPLGAALTVCGLLSASVANILQATEAGRRQPMVPLIAWAMLAGAAIDASFAYATSGAPTFDPHPRYWLGVGYLGIMGSVVTFPLYFGLIRKLGAGRAAYNGVAVPVVAMALSTLFEGYRWTGLAVAGSALALLGLLIALSGGPARGRVSASRIAASPSR